jgi:hypothetical protein
MGYGLANRPTGGEEKQIYMGIDLADNAKVDIEMQV